MEVGRSPHPQLPPLCVPHAWGAPGPLSPGWAGGAGRVWGKQDQVLVVIISQAAAALPAAMCELLLTGLQPPVWGEGISGCADAG